MAQRAPALDPIRADEARPATNFDVCRLWDYADDVSSWIDRFRTALEVADILDNLRPTNRFGTCDRRQLAPC